MSRKVYYFPRKYQGIYKILKYIALICTLFSYWYVAIENYVTGGYGLSKAFQVSLHIILKHYEIKNKTTLTYMYDKHGYWNIYLFHITTAALRNPEQTGPGGCRIAKK